MVVAREIYDSNYESVWLAGRRNDNSWNTFYYCVQFFSGKSYGIDDVLFFFLSVHIRSQE